MLLPDFLISRCPDSHKGYYGHALLIAGSYGKMGAAVLAAKACLRAGVGLLTVHVPSKGVEIMQTAVPEAMISIDRGEEHFSSIPEGLDRFDAIAIGPGLGVHLESLLALQQLLQLVCCRIVVDADGLNLLSMAGDVALLQMPAGAILTPHAREFERLYSRSYNPEGRVFADQEARWNACVRFAQKYHCVLLHKDHRSLIVSPEGESVRNTTGNAGMATAGSGDVLTGILLGLSAQSVSYPKHFESAGYVFSSYQVAQLGAYLHGKSGDIAAEKQALCGLLASDLVENLKYVIC